MICLNANFFFIWSIDYLFLFLELYTYYGTYFAFQGGIVDTLDFAKLQREVIIYIAICFIIEFYEKI